MKRLERRIGIGLLLLLLFLSAGTVLRSGAAAAGTTPTPTVTPTPPTVYQQIASSREAGHADQWTDSFGNTILLDNTDCANIVVSYTVGGEREPEASNQEIVQVLGWPDYDEETGTGALNLGRGGEIILDMNAYIRDSAGMFLYIFTTGKPEDKMRVKLSADLNTWYEIEIKSKDFTGLDKFTNIPAKVKPRYVKITDCSEKGNGVCIDAVLAFDAEPVVKPINVNAKKKPWYEKFGMTKKSATAMCICIGTVVFVIVVLALLRRINIFRHRRKRKKLRLVYDKDRDGARDGRNGE